MDVPARAGRLRERLGEAGCEALLVTELANLRYLTGFTGSAGLLLVLPDELLLVTDGRYRDQAGEQLAAAGVDARLQIGLTGGAQQEALSSAAAGVRRLGLEAAHVSWAAQRRYAGEWFPEAELVPTESLVEDLRQVKDEGEVARMAAAAAIADAALAAVRHRLDEGPTEAEFALELDTEVRRLGAEGASFETIVAGGPNGAKPHARPGPRRIVDGDLVVIDFGATVDGYRSDMTRTTMVGTPTPTQERMLEVVAYSQAAGVRTVVAGVECAEVDRACRDVIDEAGWGDAFLHSTGHGVGLDIHEEPRVSAGSTATLVPGHVVTVEPGVYLPEHGGVRIEDTVVVTTEGCRLLTLAPKDPELP
ncbi:MAG: aminopeptidase P family protein [Actinobacteria bacterium]|nr:aminopeptidase P family protein [Actinomycetota bacterium]